MKKKRLCMVPVVLLFHVAAGLLSTEKFDLEKYYASRYFIRKQENGTTFYTTSQSEHDAFAKLSPLAPNCSFPDDVSEVSCEKLDNKLCDERSTSPSGWKSYSFYRDSCVCDLDECDELNGTSTATILYPGCFCDRTRRDNQCNFMKSCPQWTDITNTPLMKLEAYHHVTFGSYAQAGYKNMYLSKKTASMKSKVFRQSGLNCTLNFWHHFIQQSSSSKIVVRVHLLSGETRALYEYYRGPEDRIWLPAAVLIGSFNQPFHITIDCETGIIPKKKKAPQYDENGQEKELEIFSCGLAAVSFDNCEEIRDPIGTCAHGDQFLCSTESNTRCLVDAQCDMKADCEDLSDELECENVYGSNCDFDGPSICMGWKQYTRILDVLENQFQVTTKAPINARPNESPEFLWKLKSPSSKNNIQKEARKGAGSFLSFESQTATSLSMRTSALVSPEFPRTNPLAYDKNSKYFETCKLRFYLCTKAFLAVWHISIISRNADNEKRPFDGGRTSLFEPKAFVSATDFKSTCEWERIMINIPRQNGKFRLGVFVEHNKDQEDFIAIDDLSFSPSCFEKDVNESTWQTPDLLVSTCGATGFEKPQSCDRYRALDGQSGHFRREDGTQEWTVPVTGFYRIEACGAAGGSANSRDGDKGECVSLQVHFMENIAIQMLVGQMGESACIGDHDDDAKPASCAKIDKNKNRGIRPAGGGGGGATLITVESSVWNVVVGGGAGASWSNEDNSVGYGASVIPVDIDEKCTDVCRSISHSVFNVMKGEYLCPKHKDQTVLGGFGGGGNSCGMRGGSGAGYRGGNPFGRGRERSGSSNVTANFAREVGYYQAEKVEDGYIKISFCRKQCTLPTVCRFKKDHFEEEYCGCPDGSEYNNSTESCLCLLDCPSGATCQYRNYTSEPMCLCDNGKHIEDFDVDYCEESQPWMWYNYLFTIFLLGALGCAFVILFHYKNSAKKSKEELINLNLITASRYQYDDVYFGMQTRKEAIKDLPFIPRESVKLGRVLGRGNFGEVQYGEYDGKKLAVKIISKPFSSSLSAQADFCNEALCMGTFVDKNVVQLVGVDFEETPYLLALEFMEGGDLLSFVKESRPNHISLNPFHLTMSDLIQICSDVASGCKCLEGFKYVHRDIAARNILLTTRGHGRVAKIADFGMAKEIKNDREYYRVHGRAMLPIKWTPPEAFIDGVFTTKSDVWSFGILCWEVFSLGVVPYPNRRNEEVMLMLTEGARLEYPYGIPTRIYQLMRECWRTDPESRPEFSEISKIVDDILNDPSAFGMPFPIHPTVRASYAHAQSTPVSVETPQTAMTDISLSSAFTDASTIKVAAQQDVQDRIKLHEMMLTREQPYTSEMTSCVVDHIRKDLARAQFETGTTSVPQPEYLSPDSIDESVQLIPNGNVLTEQTPPTSMLNLSHLAVQNTGPTLHRPDSLNFNNQYSAVPLLECQTN